MPSPTDTRLHESLQLLHDPVLAEPERMPWQETGLGVVVVLLGLWAFLRWRRPRPAPFVAPVAEAREDFLAALENAWRSATPGTFNPSITAMTAIMRRHLSRQWQLDCTSCTTAELVRIRATDVELSIPSRECFENLAIRFFIPADEVRFAGLPASAPMLRTLYESARDYVLVGEDSGSAPRPLSTEGGVRG